MDVATQIELTDAFRTLIEQGREKPSLTCPYDEGVVYTVTFHNGREVTGVFGPMMVERPFWTFVETLEGGAGDWLDINPAYVLTVKAADGAEYAKHREAFGDAS